MIRLKRYLCCAFIFCTAISNVQAGAFLYAAEGQEDIITHPQGYDRNVSGLVNVDVCIVPGSPNAVSMEVPVQNIVNTWNKRFANSPNIFLGASSDLAANQVDFESVALHEMGHCVGLAHSNAATESGLSGVDRDYTRATDGLNNSLDLNAGGDGVVGTADDLRGDDGNLHWYRISNNNPFTIDSVVDVNTYARNPGNLPPGHNYAANGSRELGVLLGYSNSEAVMNQGTYFDEDQRTLSFDDVASLRLAMSGLDMTDTTADDYVLNLRYGGIKTTGCEINMSFDDTQTGFAVCATSATGILFNPNHAKITGANIYFNNTYNWYFNSSVNEADLSIDISALPDPVPPGASLNYLLSVQNNSAEKSSGVVVSTMLPIDVAFVSTSGCVEDPLGVPNCTLGSVGGSTTASFTIATTVASNASGSLLASATVGSLGNVDPVSTNDAAVLSTMVGIPPEADLSVMLADSPDPIVRQNTLTYLVTLDNNGEATANNVTLIDILPTGVSYISASASQGTCALNVTTLVCDLGTLAPQAVASLEIRVNADQSGVVTNTVSVSTSTYESNTGNNSVSSQTRVDPIAAIISVQPDNLSNIQAPDSQDGLLLTISNSAVVDTDLNWSILESDDNCLSHIDVPWISTSATTGVSQPGVSEVLTVLLDSTGQAGSLGAALCVQSNDPINTDIVIPVSMIVSSQAGIVDEEIPFLPWWALLALAGFFGFRIIK